MEIIDDKALLFRTRNPSKYSVLPKHKVVSTEGEVSEVLVHWGLDEVRVLRNLGVKSAPSPITRKYDWPGRFKPMDHQVETAAFLTINRRAFCFNDPGCVDSETEYLSPTGWKRIADYTDGDVAQYHPDTGAMEFVKPEKFVKLPCDEMVKLKTKYGLDQMLSPEHRMLVHSNKADKHCVMSAAEVLKAHDKWHAGARRQRGGTRKGTSDVAFASMGIPTVFNTVGGAGVALSDAQLKVQVAVMADGHFSTGTNRCVVRLKRARKVARLRELLTAAGIAYKEREQNTPTAQGFTIFTFPAPLRLKVYDARFWGCTPSQLAIIAEEVVHWDGSDPGVGRGVSFSTTIKGDADFIQYVWASCGFTARITEDRRPGKYRTGAAYTVQARSGAKGGKYGLLTMCNRVAPTLSVVPSTDGFKYCFTVPSTFLLFRRNGCIFASGNTGKTLSALWAADYLMKRKEVRRVLILCPLSIMHSAWMQDLSNSVIHRSAVVCHHAQGSRRVEMVKNGYEIVIANFDGLNLIAPAIKEDGTFDLVIVDECSSYQNPSTRRWKALSSIVTPNTFLWMMTGTPSAQSPIGAYGLARLVNPAGVPAYKTAWRDKVMNKLTDFKWVAKPDAKDTVYQALQPAIRYTKAQCLDLPPVVTMTREVPMSAQQAKYYKIIKEQMLATVVGATITAVNAGVALSKLLQVSAGAALTDTQEVVEFDCAPRMSVLEEILEETDRKVLIFAMFRASIDTIVAHLTKKGYAAEQIHGGVSAGHRGEIIRDFQTTDKIDVLVMQPQSTAHGITLTAADTVVFYGPLMSVEQYIQAIARADRKGQNAEKVTVIHIESSPVEKKLFKALAGKVDENVLLTDLFLNEVKN